MNLWQRRNLVVFCLLGLALTVSAQAQRYSVGTPIGTPEITQPPADSGVGLGTMITLKCRPLTDYDYDNYTCSTVEDGATITWTAKDNANNDVGTFTDNQGPIAVWTAPAAEGPVTIYATADDNPNYLADDAPKQNSVVVNVVKRVYVKPGSPGLNTGGSWYDAFTDLKVALTEADPDWEIWVAQGTYYPGAAESDTFSISDVAVYGGFCGNERSFEDRVDPCTATYVTTLSGDIDANGLNAGNCHQVVSMSGGRLDGFTITMGYNDDSGAGGGLGCSSGSPTIANCVFTLNYADDGGAVYCSGSSPTFSHCAFNDNEAGDSGGAIYYTASSGLFDTCTFADNNSVDSAGAARLRDASSPTFNSCTFTGNVAEGTGLLWPIGQQQGMGGALNISNSSPTLNNCTISGNTGFRHGGGIRIDGSTCNVSITGGSVTGNTAVCHDGGGIEVQGGAQVTIRDLSITYNHADFNGVDNPDDPNGEDDRHGDGGGICIEGTGTNVTIYDSIVQYNTCCQQGGGCRQKNSGDWDADGFTENNCLYNLHWPYRVPEDYDNIWD